jgi:MinD superfamily P-loop ATPase
VVRRVKDYADPEAINIIDASPGTSCPAVEAVRGSDVAVLVTEPTPFGLNDLKLAVDAAESGTGCPVIASVSGVDLVLIVTEPTISGVHDMERVLQLSAHFGLPSIVIINKADLNVDHARRIRRIAEEAGSRVIGNIPFDRNVNDALMNGKTIIDHGKGPAYQAVLALWDALRTAAFEEIS